MSKIIKIAGATEVEIREVADVIREGGVVVIPTDTVYGLATNPFLDKSVLRIFRIKKRSLSKPIPVLVSSIMYVQKIAYLDNLALRLARRFWPGALTLVLPLKNNISKYVTAGRNKIGIRVPNHEVALRIIEESGGIVTGTSANISGHPPPRNVKEIEEDILNQVDIVVDSGEGLGTPSTVIDLTVQPPRIIREGAIRREELSGLIGLGT